MAQSNLQQEISRLRTLQESFDVIATLIEGHQEVVTVNLSANTDVDWTQYAVTLFDRADDIQTVHQLDASGKCTFNVELGHQYQITLPTVAGYVTPPHRYYSAVQNTRFVTYEYSENTQTERLRITISDEQLGKISSDILDGETLSVYATDGSIYSAVVAASTCVIEIPYGKTYTLTPPTKEGYRCSTTPRTYEAGTSYRYATFLYNDERYGVFGVDDDGNMYTIEQMEALGDKNIIKYGYYNDSVLASSMRPDGGTGNGFYWEIGHENIGGYQWCVQNIEFDTARLPFYANLADWKYAGAYMTDKIIEIGRELLPDTTNPTPAATACVNKTITIAGREHRGFLPAYDQIYKIATDNRTLFQSFYAALGRTAPTIWSGSWWSSCQRSATAAVTLYYGGFDNGFKSGSSNVFCVYDL